MEKPGFITKIRQSLHDDSHWLTRRKLVVFGATLIVAGFLLGMFESEGEAGAVYTARKSSTLPCLQEDVRPNRRHLKMAKQPAFRPCG